MLFDVAWHRTECVEPTKQRADLQLKLLKTGDFEMTFFKLKHQHIGDFLDERKNI